MDLGWAWWLIGALVFCFLIVIFLALGAANEPTDPEEQMRCIRMQEEERRRRKVERERRRRK